VAVEAGQNLLQYRLIEKTGEGGMGVVWKAEDTRLHHHVAPKFVSEEDVRDTQAVDRHLREARAASAHLIRRPVPFPSYECGSTV
jgi:serine/threonine protein kinase